MNELEIMNLYTEAKEDKNNKFFENINSNLHVKTAYDRVNTNFEWLEIMEDTIRYLDNILRNPNRFSAKSIMIHFYIWQKYKNEKWATR